MQRKYAVRHLLPLEMAVALLSTLPAGFSAWFGHGPLWEILQPHPDFLGFSHNVWWGVTFVLLGGGLFAVAAWEWTAGRDWDDERLRCVAVKRFWFALLLCVCHLSLAWLLIGGGHLAAVFSIAAETPAAVGLLAWSVYKLGCLLIVLDPNIPSERIEREWSRQPW